MHTLFVNDFWDAQIAALRDQVTEETHLIRFDNGYYRVCRGGPGSFEVRVVPTAGSQPGVRLKLRERDLYVTHIGERPFTRYASTLDRLKPRWQSVDSALMMLHKAPADEHFELQSLVVFCVAESLRNDHIATRIAQLLRVTKPAIIGVPPHLPMGELLEEARAWGQTSEAVMAALSPAAQAIVLQPRAQLTLQQRQFHERVDLTRVDVALRHWARSIKVIKRPGA